MRVFVYRSLGEIKVTDDRLTVTLEVEPSLKVTSADISVHNSAAADRLSSSSSNS